MAMPHWRDFVGAEGPDGAYLPWKKVEPRVGISRTTAWRLQRAGDFPKPYVVSPGRVAYRESEVEAWKASRGHRSPAHGPATGIPVAACVLPGGSGRPGRLYAAGAARAAPPRTADTAGADGQAAK